MLCSRSSPHIQCCGREPGCWGSGGVSGSEPATHRVGVPSELAAKHVPDAIVVLLRGAAVVDDNVRQHLHPPALQPPHAPEKAGGQYRESWSRNIAPKVTVLQGRCPSAPSLRALQPPHAPATDRSSLKEFTGMSSPGLFKQCIAIMTGTFTAAPCSPRLYLPADSCFGSKATVSPG